MPSEDVATPGAWPTSIALIWAQSGDRSIGKDNAMPWYLPEDAARFRELTHGHPVIMGRRTWESLPDRFRPLPGRTNVVISRTVTDLPGAHVVPDVAAATALAAGQEAWVIGGAQVYDAFMPLADRLEVTQIDVVVGGDTPAPTMGAGWRLVRRDPEQGWHTSSTGLRYRFLGFDRLSGTGGIPAQRRTDAL